MRSIIVFLSVFTLVFAVIIDVPGDQPTIQSGLNAASEGDGIRVSAGIYFENILWPGVSSLKLTGVNPDSCIIDGNGTGSVIRFEEEWTTDIDSTTVISGLTIQNGLADGVNPYNCGGGIYCRHADPSISDLIIIGNAAHSGGGIFFFSSAAFWKSRWTIVIPGM